MSYTEKEALGRFHSLVLRPPPSCPSVLQVTEAGQVMQKPRSQALVRGEEEREPGTHCLCMHQVPLVTCILLLYTKINRNFSMSMFANNALLGGGVRARIRLENKERTKEI